MKCDEIVKLDKKFPPPPPPLWMWMWQHQQLQGENISCNISWLIDLDNFLQFWPNLIILTKIHNFQQNHISQNWYFCQIWYLCQIITFSIVDIFINRFWYFYQHLIFISIIDIFINCLLEYQLVVPVNCNFANFSSWQIGHFVIK